MTYYSSWKIGGHASFPGLILNKLDDGARELNRLNAERGIPNDFQVTLNILERPGIALISALDGRGTKDGSPPHTKFLCYSFSSEDSRHIITAYLIYLYEGPVLVHALNDSEKSLFGNVDMYHVGSHPSIPDSCPGKVICKHLERIAGKELQTEDLGNLAEKTYFDMLWNVPSF